MFGAGAASKLIKSFNFLDIPATLYIIFTSGGIDFVGGYTYYNFLKTSLSADNKSLSKVPLQE
jgi:hypothetical protein